MKSVSFPLEGHDRSSCLCSQGITRSLESCGSSRSPPYLPWVDPCLWTLDPQRYPAENPCLFIPLFSPGSQWNGEYLSSIYNTINVKEGGETFMCWDKQALSFYSEGSCDFLKVTQRIKSLISFWLQHVTHQAYLCACAGKQVLCSTHWTKKQHRHTSCGLLQRPKEAPMSTPLSGIVLCVGGKLYGY